MSQSILVERSGNAVVLRFNRPAIKNPLSIAALEELEEIFASSESNPAIETIIFTGSGDTFASGANLKEIARLNETTAREFGRRGQALMQRVYHSDKTTVAAVDGFCMGGALDLAMSCTRRIASPRSIFAHPGVGLGIITGWSGTQILPRLIGEARALEMFLTAKRVDAVEALRVGLIDLISDAPLADSLANFPANRTS